MESPDLFPLDISSAGGDEISSTNDGDQFSTVKATNQRRRACDECKRKKTKCDMKRPKCSLCDRTGRFCVFPEPAENPVRCRTRQRKARAERKGQRLERLLSILESGFDRSDARFQANIHSTPAQPSLNDPMMCLSYGTSLPPTHAMETVLSDSFSEEYRNEIWQPDTTSSLQVRYNDIFLDPANLQSSTRASPNIVQQVFDFDSTHQQSHDIFNGTRASLDPFSNKEASTQEPLNISSTVDNEYTEAHESVTGEYVQIPGEICHHLLELFFEKIQIFLPLFHQPSFESEFKEKIGLSGLSLASITLEAAFVLNAMFALSARYSGSGYFSDLKPSARGESFAKQAETFLAKNTFVATEQPSLRLFQGHILLACYYLSSGITSRAWILIGSCSRIAYELGLDTMDRDIINLKRSENAQEWVVSEERRRAWWSAWELDNFASTISCRPYGFDRYQTEILLPVSDRDWIRGVPVASAPLGNGPLAASQSLVDSQNQSERAWYLISVHLVRLGRDLQRDNSPLPFKTWKDYETGVTYFTLALPPKFDISSSSFGRGSADGWIICTHFMLQSLLLSAAFLGPEREWGQNSHTSSVERSERMRTSCKNQTAEVLSTIRAWAPRLMPFSPFIACTIVGPQAIHVKNCLSTTSMKASFTEPTSERDMEILTLCMKRHAWYWELGTLLLDVIQLCSKRHSRNETSLSPKEEETLRRLPLIAEGVVSAQ